MDFQNAYYFRGIPQEEAGVVMWPAAALRFSLFSGDGAVRGLGVVVGTWNSLHSGPTGSDGPTGRLWFESRFYAAAEAGFSGGVSVAATYTAYTSPNGSFQTVKEAGVKVTWDDSGLLGAVAIRPYALVARELDEGGQADVGLRAGTYLELGAAPGFTTSRVSITAPLRVGLSLGDYYEGFNGDERFGFFSIAGVATVPLGRGPTRFGSWNVHGGVEHLRLGGRNRLFGETDRIASVGIGFSY
jgi:hypothetical protein